MTQARVPGDDHRVDESIVEATQEQMLEAMMPRIAVYARKTGDAQGKRLRKRKDRERPLSQRFQRCQLP